MRRPKKTEDSREGLLQLPFIFGFGQKLPELPRHPLRYDAARQISQVLIHGRWVDGPDASGELMASTRLTKVERETTDDE